MSAETINYGSPQIVRNEKRSITVRYVVSGDPATEEGAQCVELYITDRMGQQLHWQDREPHYAAHMRRVKVGTSGGFVTTSFTMVGGPSANLSRKNRARFNRKEFVAYAKEAMAQVQELREQEHSTVIALFDPNGPNEDGA